MMRKRAANFVARNYIPYYSYQPKNRNKNFIERTKIYNYTYKLLLPYNSVAVNNNFAIQNSQIEILKKKESFQLVANENGVITDFQLEAIRKIIRRLTKKIGFLQIRVAPIYGKTKKPAEVRMGKGKGKIDHYLAPVEKGQIICELSELPFNLAHNALKAAAIRLGFICSIASEENLQ